jgi:nucleotide-binding universal stress UspA family protein
MGQKEVTMFDKIIVPLDGSLLSEQIVPYTGALAKAMHIPVQLLHVVDPDVQRLPDVDDTAHPVFYDQLLEHRQTWARVYLQGVAQRLEAAGVTADPRVIIGTPEHAIRKAAGEDGTKLVAMATHGRSGIGRMILGSVTDQVVREGKMPMLLSHPKSQRAAFLNPPRTVLVALDGSAFAERALAMGQYVARATGARMLLARVVPIFSYALASPEVIAYGRYPDPVSTAREETRAYLQERERDTAQGGIEVQSVMLEGDPAQEIIRLASAPDSLIVLTTHGRSGLRRAVLGSVADEVVRRAGTPVLLLRAAEG